MRGGEISPLTHKHSEISKSPIEQPTPGKESFMEPGKEPFL